MTAPSVGAARRRFAAAGALALALCLLVPRPAYADIAGDINSWLCGLLRDLCNWIFSAQVDVLSGIGYDGVLSSAFDSMLARRATSPCTTWRGASGRRRYSP